LTLLLKYPVPDRPHGPQSFVEDAILLRENFTPTGARKIITSYSGRAPQHYASTSRPATPSGAALNPDQRMLWRRSPLPSPARFLQNQGGVEALLQGAAKGVFERGERLGINKAVRDAVGEVKKNMQNLQTPSPPSIRRSPDAVRRSLDESRAASSTRKTVAWIEQRNKQLSQMLDDALSDLRNLSAVEIDATSKSTDAIDLAIAKVQFVQVYLEDSSMPLPTEPSQSTSAARSLRNSTTDSTSLQTNKDPLLESEKKDSLAHNKSNVDNTLQAKSIEALEVPNSSTSPSSSTTPSESSGGGLAMPARPRAPIPTRSTLAQSSFAFMLEPDESSVTTARSSSPKSSSPFLASGKRPLSGGSREKAFLFGGESEDGEQSPWNRSPHSGADQEYNLGTIKGSKGL
jgi:TBC1 domain family member 5